MLLLTSAVPAPGTTDTPTPTKALRITLPEMTTSRRYLPQPAMIPNDGAFSITLPVTEVSASAELPVPASSSGAVPIGRFGSRLRMMLPCTTAMRPASLKLQAETPTAAPPTVSWAITAPSNENSEYSATSRTLLTLLPVTWILDAELPRTAE